jgi:catechol 2,3-dioxygenase-like lactoylglutathione lyase family enzyme
MPNRIVWCDIPVIDLDRAIRFYSAVLGAPVAKQEFSGMSLGLFPDADSAVSGCLFVAGADTQPSTKGPLVYLNCSGGWTKPSPKLSKTPERYFSPSIRLGHMDFGLSFSIAKAIGSRCIRHKHSSELFEPGVREQSQAGSPCDFCRAPR